MLSSIRPWGNSQGIYIPKKMLLEAAMELNETVELKVVEGGIMICKDESRDMRYKALESLRSIRAEHMPDISAEDRDYRKDYEDYLDERYGKK